MNIIAEIVSAFFKAFLLIGTLLLHLVDSVSTDMRHVLVHQGLHPLLAVAIVSLIPVLSFIAAWRIFAGYMRLSVCAYMAAAFARISVPVILLLVRNQMLQS